MIQRPCFDTLYNFLKQCQNKKKLFQHHPYNPGCLQSKWPALPGSNLIYFQWLRENYYVQNGEAADLPKKGKNKSKCIALKKQTTSRNRTFLHSSALSSIDIFWQSGPKCIWPCCCFPPSPLLQQQQQQQQHANLGNFLQSVWRHFFLTWKNLT